MGKFFTNGELNNVEISEDVIVSVAAYTAAEVEGVVPTGTKPATLDFKELISKKSFGKNVSVTEQDGKIALDVAITVEYGKQITEVCKNVQKAVYTAVADSTGLEVGSVNVTVAGVYFPKSE